MNTSEIEYLGDLRTRAVHIHSGNVVLTDAPLDNQGKGEFFSPTDLVTSALGSCMLTLMGIAARTHQIEIDGSKVELLKIMAANPRRISGIKATVHISNSNLSEKQKAILENAARTCPVIYSLHPDIEKELNFIYP